MKQEQANVMIDSNGQSVPVRYVSRFDKLRDRKVGALVKRWQKQRQALQAEMARTLADLEGLLQAREKETGAGQADRGNFRVSSFDGNAAVELRQQYRIYLDERVLEARRIMLEWGTGMVSEDDATKRRVILALIEEAFSASSSGALPIGKILSLLKHDFPGKEWARAKKLLVESMKPERGKCYVAVSVRPSRQHDFARVKLDIADCWPEPAEEVPNGKA